MIPILSQAAADSTALPAAGVLTDPDFWHSLLAFLVANGPRLGMKLLGAAAILLLGRFLAGGLRRGLRKVMTARRVDPSLVGFVSSMVYFTILAFTVVAVVGQFGVQTASFVAILGAAGFAVGMALQGTLANFASGVMLLMFRPFKPGDFIEAAGVKGTVNEILIFSTTLDTLDNVRITVPNGKLYGDIIKNYNGNATRRVDMTAPIGYGADLGRAIRIIEGLLAADPRVLKEPAPVVAVGEWADSSVNVVVRPWVRSEDYQRVMFDFQRNCKEAFDAAGIEIPFPQRVVHMRTPATDSFSPGKDG